MVGLDPTIAYVRMTFDEVRGASGPVTGPKTHRTCMSLCLAEEREQSTLCSIHYAPKLIALDTRGKPKPPPTFPFLESQCQRARIQGEISFCQRWIAARKKCARERRGRGLYEGVPPKSNPKNQIVSGSVDDSVPRARRLCRAPSIGRPAPRATTGKLAPGGGNRDSRPGRGIPLYIRYATAPVPSARYLLSPSARARHRAAPGSRYPLHLWSMPETP